MAPTEEAASFMSSVPFAEPKGPIDSFLAQQLHSSAAARDSASNVAARVLSIFPRYCALDRDYATTFGPEMSEKAEAIRGFLGKEPAEFWTEDTPENRARARQALEHNPELLGQLATIIQAPSTAAQVLTEELDEIDRARQL